MANKHRGYVTIELDKPRKLRYDTNALAELEDVFGKPLGELFQDQDVVKLAGVKTLRALFWAGLLHEQPDLTIKQAGELMDYSDIQTIGEKVAEALQLAFGGEQGKNKKSGPNGIGRR